MYAYCDALIEIGVDVFMDPSDRRSFYRSPRDAFVINNKLVERSCRWHAYQMIFVVEAITIVALVIGITNVLLAQTVVRAGIKSYFV